ncbi:zinc-binding dehydrogenase [Paeniglutamicibacter gangotriensis]|uniref:zinc-binding dehydrogenase n=1 Tax=Paeniglutamicibacter gangotriensis TaxID=254787 RepID=UPI0021D0024D|nr:zinc-binding dehydrogenase [Paeniglutamicibacter gangotriensis]
MSRRDSYAACPRAWTCAPLRSPNRWPLPCMEAAGAAASLQTMLDATRRGGTVVQLGILPRDAVSISLSELGLRELTVFGSQRFETELDEAVELLAEHKFLAEVISHDFPLAEAEAAFAMALDSTASSKVVIKVGALEA